MEDEDAVESFLAEKGINWDATKMDATIEGTLIREVLEETGLHIASSKVEHVDTFGTVNIGSGGGRNNHTDHFFLADLGNVEELTIPQLQKEEVAEAKWVKLSDIQRQADGSYNVEGGQPLEQGQALRMELALQQRLNNQVAGITGMRMDLSGVQTLAGTEGAAATRDILERAETIGKLMANSPEASGTLPSLPRSPIGADPRSR